MKKYMALLNLLMIEEVQITKETEDGVYIITSWSGGFRDAKRSPIHEYFDTYEEAKKWLLQVTENKIKNEQENLKQIKKLKEEV